MAERDRGSGEAGFKLFCLSNPGSWEEGTERDGEVVFDVVLGRGICRRDAVDLCCGTEEDEVCIIRDPGQLGTFDKTILHAVVGVRIGVKELKFLNAKIFAD